MNASIAVVSIYLAEAGQVGGDRRLSTSNFQHYVNINKTENKEGDEHRK